MKVRIIMTEQQYTQILRELFPDNNANEHFGFGLAGIALYKGGCNLLLRHFIAADSSCLNDQSGVSVRPHPVFVNYIWDLAKNSRSSLIDFHTHPFSAYGATFSGIDDRSEHESFPAAVKYLGNGPHGSMVLGRNSIDARWYDWQHNILKPVYQVRIVGLKTNLITPTSSHNRRGNHEISI